MIILYCFVSIFGIGAIIYFFSSNSNGEGFGLKKLVSNFFTSLPIIGTLFMLLFFLWFVIKIVSSLFDSGINVEPTSNTLRTKEIVEVKKQVAIVHEKIKNELQNGKIESIEPIVSNKELGDPIQTDVIKWHKRQLLANYWFDSEIYTIETGGKLNNILDNTQIDAACKAIDEENEKLRTRNSILDKIKINMGASWKVLDIGLEMTAQDLAEMLGVIQKYQGLDYQVEIFIKGYADNSVNPNWRNKMDRNYLFKDLKICKVTEDEKRLHPYNPKKYENIETSYVFSSDQTYGDSDLPNLRAAFIRYEFVEPFLREYNPNNKITKVYILEGFHYKDANHPENRMVEVYFQVYPKKGNHD